MVGIGHLESIGFQKNATSSTGAKGLYQFTEGTWLDQVAKSNQPELQALQYQSRSKQLAARNDPHLNALAAAQYMKSGVDDLQAAFTKNGIRATPTAEDVYSYHNTGNVGLAVAAHKGLTVSQAKINGHRAVSDYAISVNSGLYPQGRDTPAQDYMAKVSSKLEKGMVYLKNRDI